jgi:hypothetical protein
MSTAEAWKEPEAVMPLVAAAKRTFHRTDQKSRLMSKSRPRHLSFYITRHSPVRASRRKVGSA